ncbi:hypothetical protein [Clostridium gasigenes]|uniref:Uncharacterized protein n=1 Tax=Clostridium gasigenes TaxID=94869 RepID=A0A7X0SBN2_9CLOT|nr:hypothetical protein [Clostridium gasigenes]MBB6714535.1 hypothetical protein [Clostridium gasigenes]
MQVKDYITITISLIALLFSFSSLIFTFLNFRRNVTRLKIKQLHFSPNPFRTSIRPNILYLDKKQNKKFWEIIPIVHLIIYIKIDNLSYTGITISNFIINDKFLGSKLNTDEMKKELVLSFFASEESQSRDLKRYGNTVPASATTLKPNDYNSINIGDKIESKSSIEGVIIISGNWDLYNVVNDGINKLTIVTPDKKFDTHIEIYRTVIPSFPKN